MLPKAKNVPNGRFATRMERNAGDGGDASARSGRLPCGRPYGGRLPCGHLLGVGVMRPPARGRQKESPPALSPRKGALHPSIGEPEKAVALYSHSIVAVGLGLKSYATRQMPGTSAMMRFVIFLSSA